MKKILAVLIILLMTTALVFAGGNNQAPTAGISVEMFDRGTDGGKTNAVDNNWITWIKDKVKKDLNLDVTFVSVGRWSETTDIINLMASGTAPDLCYTYSGDNINNWRDMGGLRDLSPYIDRLLPDMKKLLGADPSLTGKDFINRFDESGKIWNLPSYRIALAQRNVFVRGDWLGNAAPPTNVQQFHDLLVQFKARGTNIIPLGGDEDIRWGWANIINNFITANSDYDRFVYSGAERNILFPGYKEGVRALNTWFNEGLINQNFATLRTTTQDFSNLLKSGNVGAFGGNWDNPYRLDLALTSDLQRNAPGATWVPVDAFQNKEVMDKVGLRIFVPAQSMKVEDSLRYLNWLCKAENYEFLQIGTVGVNHDMVDGVPALKDASGTPWVQNSSMNIDITMPMNGIERGSQELNSRVLALQYTGTPAANIVSAYDMAVKNARGPVVVTIPTSQGGVYGANLRELADALLAQAISAPAGQFDTIWDRGIQNYLQSGGQAVMDERIQVAQQARLSR